MGHSLGQKFQNYDEGFICLKLSFLFTRFVQSILPEHLGILMSGTVLHQG